MKKNIIIAILLLANPNLFAQVNIDYDTCNYLQQYAGEWKHINGQDTIRIYFRSLRTKSNEFNYINDRLWGWVEYKRGNTIIESNYQNRFDSIPYISRNYDFSKYSIRISLANCDNNTVNNPLVGRIRDSLQAGELHIVKATLDPTKTIMTWTQSHSECYGALTGAIGMTFPTNFVLIKQ